MFERINASVSKNGDKVRSITTKVVVRTNNSWKVADIQLQEGSIVTEYTEHVAEMERTNVGE